MVPDDIGAGSTADVRASDAERDRALAELRAGFAEGRLTHDTLAHRIEAALRARLAGELHLLVADLPRPRRLGMAVRLRCRSAVRFARRLLRRSRRRSPPALTLPPGAQDHFTIGREPACDMMLSDQTVSRWHASLERAAGGWLLADLGSTNGTRLNGWRVNQPIVVRPGDTVSFGAATFLLTERPG